MLEKMNPAKTSRESDSVQDILVDLLEQYFHIGGDCYTYELERHKSAFEIGTVKVNDFREWNSDDIEELVAHLIDNGVTINRWIPVTERLPEVSTTFVCYGPYAICPASEFLVMIEGAEDSATLCFNGEKWTDYDGNTYRVTHWMPKPKAPGKEQATDIEPVQGLIPVTERLPEHKQQVLAYTGYAWKPKFKVMFFYGKHEYSWADVSHWQPLPDTPKEVPVWKE